MQTGNRFRRDASCVWSKRCWWICLLLLLAAPVFALEVQEVKWGFDGQVVPGRFNLLSVLVANPGEVPFDGTVGFYKSRGMAERVGAVYRTPCYLSPMMTRWLQFYVYIDNQYDQGRLEWGRGPNDYHDLQAPKWGPPAEVLMTVSESALGMGSAFKHFSEDLFPPTVAATSGLGVVLLDHAPHWEPVKRQAFLSWLRAGGQVHLLQGADGRYPVFADELSGLNSSLDRVRIGAGLAVRHAATARQIKLQDVQEGGVPRRELKPGEPGLPAQTAESLLGNLAQLSQRSYDWGLIYILAIAYAVLVGPANLRAGRKLADYRLRIALLLATIAGFAWLFDLVGRRGQGEASVIHSLSYARAIGGDDYEVTQWVNVFATRGAQYTITHAASHNLYATGQDYESVNGVIESGKDGRFVVDIPMFSRRAFLHEAEMKGASIPIKIVSWDGAGTLKHLVLTVGPDFKPRILEGWAIQGNQIFPMKTTKDSLEFGDSSKESLASFMSGSHLNAYNYGSRQQAAVTNVEDQFRKCVKPLLAWSLGAEASAQSNAPSPAANERVQLFLFAPSPESFRLAGSGLGHEIGYVLYHFDLFKPETAEGI